MYCIECNDVLETNQEHVKALFNKFTKGYFKFLTVEDTAEMLMKKLGMNLKDVTYCYGMSKRTVVNEQEERECAKYNQMNLAEFNEMIARVAHLRIKSNELSLCRKIEYVLDDLFTLLKVKRKPVIIKEEFEETVSDTDY
jgi:hypothetical protein